MGMFETLIYISLYFLFLLGLTGMFEPLIYVFLYYSL